VDTAVVKKMPKQSKESSNSDSSDSSDNEVKPIFFMDGFN